MSEVIKRLNALYDTDRIELPVKEFANYLQKMGSANDSVLIAGSAVMHFHLSGHICISLEEIHSFCDQFGFKKLTESLFNDIIKHSTLVGDGSTLTPIVIEGQNVYLHRFWKFEQELVNWLLSRSQKLDIPDEKQISEINDLFRNNHETTNWQQVAVLISHLKQLTIITGGPGTGKTFTIDRIIRSHLNRNSELRIALTAPTGKAAQRLNDSLNEDTEERLTHPASTIHSLLGAKGSSGAFTYNDKNKLPFDLIVVDEASMLDLNLWINLIRAVPDSCRLVLLGDKNQLASVEAGSILGDICSGAVNTCSDEIAGILPEIKTNDDQPPINDCIIELTKSYRFDESSGIKKLSEAIIQEDAEEVLSILKDEEYPDVRIQTPSNSSVIELLEQFVSSPFMEMKQDEFDHQLYNKYQILCALRKGPFGVDEINRRSEHQLKQILGISQKNEWYNGRPVIINRNHYSLRLRNGETGFAMSEKSSGFQLYFDGRALSISPSRLPEYECSFAITVHKSQGSEYENVALLLPDGDNPILTKELLYTSVTRARKSLLVISSSDIISTAVAKKIVRRSGIQNKIWQTGISRD